MARKKTIMKEDILDNAYEVVRTEGFEGFTARNIAKRMNCSTQPIYLEFKNMDDLKNEIVAKITDYLKQTIFAQEREDHKLLNAAFNYIDFAHDEKTFFKAIYLENRLDEQQMHQIAKDKLKEILADSDHHSEKELNSLFAHFWASVHGIASMTAQEVIPFDKEDNSHYLERLLDMLK
ncbi:MAG: TetR/AcrR family transcriptional regulator [Pisciglobus halotolerans]|nr:TetR/AcrR family transcriptional regulator [Pisciglobus halotolerans]